MHGCGNLVTAKQKVELKSLPFGTSEAEAAGKLTAQSRPKSWALGFVDYRKLVIESLEQFIPFGDLLVIDSLCAVPTTATSSTSTATKLLRS